MNSKIHHGIKACLLKSSKNLGMDRVVAYERQLLKGFSGCDAQESSMINKIETSQKLQGVTPQVLQWLETRSVPKIDCQSGCQFDLPPTDLFPWSVLQELCGCPMSVSNSNKLEEFENFTPSKWRLHSLLEENDLWYFDEGNVTTPTDPT